MLNMFKNNNFAQKYCVMTFISFVRENCFSALQTSKIFRLKAGISFVFVAIFHAKSDDNILFKLCDPKGRAILAFHTPNIKFYWRIYVIAYKILCLYNSKM